MDDPPCCPEIAELEGVGTAIEEEVLRLHIAVDDAPAVGEG
eukprot:CAMPEP_0170620422 /NCGR_PEP_ID=MMETSP0224-20130122/28049_1 /TAXON_ID=285029 /ORGANISM="Togula jolla, Strain CCCM 725" /LENGTH=40 /DNA_ID= /DNA_START= /DNA_END= /DNA_ORIENTATION=